MDIDWNQVREAFEPAPGVAYLNTGTAGRTPRPVLDAANEWRRRIAAEPCQVLWRDLPELLWPARERLARFVGATPQAISFMANVTAGINTVTSGLKLEPGRDILISDQEYGAMVFAWERAAARAGAAIRTAAIPVAANFSKQDLIDRFAAAFDESARAGRPAQILFISHITTATGLILPVRELCELARHRGAISVIDGAHAPGMIPLDVTSLGCDFYIGNGHKWLLAPLGSGFLYVRPGLEMQIEPLVVSWGWKYDDAKGNLRDAEGSTYFIRSQEFQGSRDPAPWLAMPTAIEFHERLGAECILARDRELAAYARRRLTELAGVVPAIPDDPQLAAALVAYRLPRGDAIATQRALWQRFQIEAPVLDRPGGLFLRVSTHFYNTTYEIDRLHTAVRELLG